MEGTKVCDLSGNKIGEIDHLMIDKASGNVRYAIMSFGGFLGLGLQLLLEVGLGGRGLLLALGRRLGGLAVRRLALRLTVLCVMAFVVRHEFFLPSVLSACR